MDTKTAIEHARLYTSQLVTACKSKLNIKEKELSESQHKIDQLSKYIKDQNSLIAQQRAIIVELKKKNKAVTDIVNESRIQKRKKTQLLDHTEVPQPKIKKNDGTNNGRTRNKFSYGLQRQLG